MKAIKPSLTRTVTSPSKSSRLMAPSVPSSSAKTSSQKCSFHSTPQDAAYTRPTMGSSYTSGYHQHQAPAAPSQHPYDTRMYSSEAARRRGSDGVAFDEDMIEELRPIFAEKARSKGQGTGKSGEMRAMHTGKGEEWVW